MNFFLSLSIVLMVSSSLAAQPVTSFSIKVVGKGEPMTLVHGLYCSGEVWEEVVEHYQDRYECHILTLAGFGGADTVATKNFLETVKNDIIQYANSKKLQKPILLGHSMGGFVALWAAASNSKIFSKVISIDGLPFVAALRAPNASPDSLKAIALNAKARMSAPKTHEQFIASQKQTLPLLASDSGKVEKLLKISLQAHTGTQNQAMYEMLITDLRNAVSNIERPVLLFGSWIGGKAYGASHKGLLQSYQAQVMNIKDVRIEISDTAKHFIFYDDPQWFYAKVDEFLHNESGQ